MLLFSALAALLLSGCVSTRANHGYVVELGETGLEAIPGVDTKESVLARYGEPSVRPPLNDDVWYYISQRTNARAFFLTEVYDRTVVAFAFDEEGHVAGVETLTLEDGQEVDIVARKTATRGREASLFEQIFGGVGVGTGVPGAAGPGGPGGPGGP
ncbi:MAG: outer membrane protein assembly factor BamE [Pseudomonadota bacterium]